MANPIREAALKKHHCPRCKATPGEKCHPHGKPSDIVCCDRFTKAKKEAR